MIDSKEIIATHPDRSDMLIVGEYNTITIKTSDNDDFRNDLILCQDDFNFTTKNGLNVSYTNYKNIGGVLYLKPTKMELSKDDFNKLKYVKQLNSFRDISKIHFFFNYKKEHEENPLYTYKDLYNFFLTELHTTENHILFSCDEETLDTCFRCANDLFESNIKMMVTLTANLSDRAVLVDLISSAPHQYLKYLEVDRDLQVYEKITENIVNSRYHFVKGYETQRKYGLNEYMKLEDEETGAIFNYTIDFDV